MNEIPDGYRELPPSDQTTPSVLADAVNAVKRSPDEVELQRLAKLSLLDYEREREAAADKIGIRKPILDQLIEERRPKAAAEGEGNSVAWREIEPWPEPINGSDLLDGLIDACERYMVLPPGAADAIALWVLHAHTIDTAAISPILAITSPTPECGKTTLMTLLQTFVPRPIAASNITGAALFRAVEKWQPSLLIDEADTFLKNNDELRGIINSGHNRASANIIRTTGEDYEPQVFRTWAAKAIALIGKLPQTLESRAIHVELRRKGPSESVAILRGDRTEHLYPLAQQAARWAADHIEEIGQIDPDMPAIVTGRRADNWRHLIAIADCVGGIWPERARAAAETLSAGHSEDTAGIMLLSDIRDIFEERTVDYMASVELAGALAQMETRPWPEWGKSGKPITVRQTARLLAPFHIAPGTIRTETGTLKGYQKDKFFDVFARYLPIDPSHRHNPQKSAENEHSPSVTNGADVTDEKTLKPALTNGCDGVTDGIPQKPVNTELSADQRAYLATLEDDPEERAALQDE
jgi:putative DNA primase/helicase